MGYSNYSKVSTGLFLPYTLKLYNAIQKITEITNAHANAREQQPTETAPGVTTFVNCSIAYLPKNEKLTQSIFNILLQRTVQLFTTTVGLLCKNFSTGVQDYFYTR